jgi:hypothetical protein
MDYNQERLHEALGQRTPAELYHPSRRGYPRGRPSVQYAVAWAVRQVRQNGEIKWQGRRRFIGEAFVGQPKTAAELDALLPAVLDKAFKGEL